MWNWKTGLHWYCIMGQKWWTSFGWVRNRLWLINPNPRIGGCITPGKEGNRIIIRFVKYFNLSPGLQLDLVCKLMMVKGAIIFLGISSGSKIDERLWYQQYDLLNMERSMGIVLGLVQTFWDTRTSTLHYDYIRNMALGTIWQTSSKPPQRRHGPDPHPLRC